MDQENDCQMDQEEDCQMDCSRRIVRWIVVEGLSDGL